MPDTYGLEVKTPPSEEPITLADAIDQLHEEIEIAQTSLIEGQITAARQHVEQILSRALVTTTYTMTLDDFGLNVAWWPRAVYASEIWLPRSPVQSVDEIRYIDTTGTQQTLDASKYRVDTKSLVARVTPAYAEIWPTTRPVTNAVEIDFTAGYGTRGDVPEPIKQAIKLLVAHFYDIRSPVVTGTTASSVPLSVESLLGPYRVVSF